MNVIIFFNIIFSELNSFIVIFLFFSFARNLGSFILDYHITAIRWTSIGLSIIWTLCLVGGVIYHYCVRKQRSQSLGMAKGAETSPSDEEDEFQIPFNEPTPEEIEALEAFANQNYSKDGFAPPKTPSQLNS